MAPRRCLVDPLALNAVYVDEFSIKVDNIARHSDNPLHEIGCRACRRVKHNDIAALGTTEQIAIVPEEAER